MSSPKVKIQSLRAFEIIGVGLWLINNEIINGNHPPTTHFSKNQIMHHRKDTEYENITLSLTKQTR